MAKYIPLDAVVAEIEKRIRACGNCYILDELTSLHRTFNTLEVKEVDYKPIDKDFERDAVQFCFDNGLNTTPRIAKTIAKHFFELGMCAANPLTVKDIKKIYHLVNEVSDDLGVRAMYVNIYQETLKRFKAQKG